MHPPSILRTPQPEPQWLQRYFHPTPMVPKRHSEPRKAMVNKGHSYFTNPNNALETRGESPQNYHTNMYCWQKNKMANLMIPDNSTHQIFFINFPTHFGFNPGNQKPWGNKVHPGCIKTHPLAQDWDPHLDLPTCNHPFSGASYYSFMEGLFNGLWGSPFDRSTWKIPAGSRNQNVPKRWIQVFSTKWWRVLWSKLHKTIEHLETSKTE